MGKPPPSYLYGFGNSFIAFFYLHKHFQGTLHVAKLLDKNRVLMLPRLDIIREVPTVIFFFVLSEKKIMQHPKAV